MARRPGRPSATSRRAALEAADGMDPSVLTLSALAQRMGVSRSTLYGYFTGDDDLVRAVIGRSWAALVWPEAEEFADWRSYLEAIVWSIWDHVQRNPGLAAAMGTVRRDASPLIPMNPAMVSALLRFGLGPDVTLLALDVLSDLTSQTFFRDRVVDPSPDPSVGAARLEGLGGLARALPEAVRGSYLRMLGGPPEEHFRRKLGVVLDGIDAAVRR